jgi:serine protease
VRVLLAVLFFATAAHGEIVPGRVLVRFRHDRAAVPLRAGARALERVRAIGPGHLYAAPGLSAAETLALAAELNARSDVAFAEPDFVRRRCDVTPNDPDYAQQWALPLIHAPGAWSRTTGSSAITIAVVDTGIVSHADLDNRVVRGYDFITDPLNAGDGDGRDPDPTDVGDSTEQSSALHGLHVAGILGAVTNNMLGVAALDWVASVQPVRVLGVMHGSGVDSDIADAIRWAAGLHVDGVPDNMKPAQVINMSFGGQGMSMTMQAAIDDAIAAGATVVVAAGNNAVDAGGDSPAGLRGVITVGAVDPMGKIANYSNFGRAVALMAPGGLTTPDANGVSQGVLSLMHEAGADAYETRAGTSQATAFVSAAVSLMAAVWPPMQAADARKLLAASADPASRCNDPTDSSAPGCGAGLLDVDAATALAAAQPMCTPTCSGELLCSPKGVCVSPASLAPGALDMGTVVHGGCTLAPTSADGGWWILLVACLLAFRYKTPNAKGHVRARADRRRG